VGHLPAGSAGHGHCLPKQGHRVGTRHLRVVRGKVLAEITQHTGPHHGIGDGMGGDITIRGGLHPIRLGHDDAPELQGRCAGETMCVEAPTDPGGRGG
jgi:hypothetical protein